MLQTALRHAAIAYEPRTSPKPGKRRHMGRQRVKSYRSHRPAIDRLLPRLQQMEMRPEILSSVPRMRSPASESANETIRSPRQIVPVHLLTRSAASTRNSLAKSKNFSHFKNMRNKCRITRHLSTRMFLILLRSEKSTGVEWCSRAEAENSKARFTSSPNHRIAERT